MTRRRTPTDADPPAGAPIFDAIEAYKAAFGEGPPVMGFGSSRIDALAALLREAVAEGRPLTDAQARHRLGMGSLPPGAMT